MKTFGEFFNQLRRWAGSTGKTDRFCGYMDDYRRKHDSGPSVSFGGETEGWLAFGAQKLSYDNLLEFSREMLLAGSEMLNKEARSEYYQPHALGWGWKLNSINMFYSAMMEEAEKCGLDTDNHSAWIEARNKIRTVSQGAQQ